MQLNIALTENTIFFWANLDHKLKSTIKNTNMIDCLSDVAHLYFQAKTLNVAPFIALGVYRMPNATSSVAQISWERFVLKSPNFTWYPWQSSLEPPGYDNITTPVGIYGSLRKQSKMRPPTALGHILVGRFACPTNWWASCCKLVWRGLGEVWKFSRTLFLIYPRHCTLY